MGVVWVPTAVSTPPGWTRISMRELFRPPTGSSARAGAGVAPHAGAGQDGQFAVGRHSHVAGEGHDARPGLAVGADAGGGDGGDGRRGRQDQPEQEETRAECAGSAPAPRVPFSAPSRKTRVASKHANSR